MTVAFPRFRVGRPVRHEALSVFPLFAELDSAAEYRLSPDALADESVVVEEISEGGSVPELAVENKADQRVLFLEGEELVGAKQNRILNTSMLIAGHSRTRIPVSCVEQGRWRYSSRRFSSSGSHSPSRLRRALKASVSRSVREHSSHRSDQMAVWSEVSSLHDTHGVNSDSSAMSDAFDSFRARIAEFRERLPYVDGAIGMAIAVGNRVVSIDVFDKPATCRQVWGRLLSGVVFDAMEAGEAPPPATVSDVERLLATVGELPWQQAPSVGEGDEYRAASPEGDQASALIFQGAIVHGSVVAV